MTGSVRNMILGDKEQENIIASSIKDFKKAKGVNETQKGT
jgi:hypothetical protein